MEDRGRAFRSPSPATSVTQLRSTLSSLEVAVDAMRSLHQVLLDRTNYVDTEFPDEDPLPIQGGDQNEERGEGRGSQFQLLGGGSGTRGALQDTWDLQAQLGLAGIGSRNNGGNSSSGGGGGDSGCPPSVIDSLTSIRAPHCDQNGVLGGACPICQEEKTSYSQQTEIKTFLELAPCSHRYCKDCIVPWLTFNTTCPVCRATVEAGPGKVVEWKVRQLLEKGESLNVRSRLGSAPVHRLRGMANQKPIPTTVAAAGTRSVMFPASNTAQTPTTSLRPESLSQDAAGERLAHQSEGTTTTTTNTTRTRPPTASLPKPRTQHGVGSLLRPSTAAAQAKPPRPGSGSVLSAGSSTVLQRATSAGQQRRQGLPFPNNINSSNQESNNRTSQQPVSTQSSSTTTEGVVGGTSVLLRQRPNSAPRPMDHFGPGSANTNKMTDTSSSSSRAFGLARLDRTKLSQRLGQNQQQGNTTTSAITRPSTANNVTTSIGGTSPQRSNDAVGVSGSKFTMPTRAGSAALIRPRTHQQQQKPQEGNSGGGLTRAAALTAHAGKLRPQQLRGGSSSDGVVSGSGGRGGPYQLSATLPLHSIASSMRVSGVQYVPQQHQVL